MPAGTQHFRIHDWRRTFATVVASLKHPPHVVEALLGHRSGVIRGVARTYNRYSYAEEKRQAVNDFARFVDGLVMTSLD